MKTAMQELRDDLVLTLETGNEALNEMSDPLIRETCQKLVELTLNEIIKRIDNELLEMEKRQIILAHGIKDTGVNNMKCVTGEQYYNKTFKKQEQ